MPNLAHRGSQAIRAVESLVLAVIALATIYAIGEEILVMFEAGTVRLGDLLLLFLFLEILAMVSAFLDAGHLPVRMPLYIAIVALARYLILDIKDLHIWEVLAVSGGVLILAVAVLVIRYGHVKFPYEIDLRGNPRHQGADGQQ
jgi:protein PsiE